MVVFAVCAGCATHREDFHLVATETEAREAYRSAEEGALSVLEIKKLNDKFATLNAEMLSKIEGLEARSESVVRSARKYGARIRRPKGKKGR